MKIFCYIFIFLIALSTSAIAQYEIGGQTLFGNEWIDFNNRYVKIKLAEDGIYRVSYDELAAAGLPMDAIKGGQFQLFYRGQEISISTTSEELWSTDDFLDFYGERNDGFLDQFITNEGAEGQLNPEYSLFTDTSAYFLTWTDDIANKRYTVQAPSDANGLTEIPYYMHRDLKYFNSDYYKPVFQGNDRVRYSNINQSEGYGQALTSNPEVSFSVTDKYEDVQDASSIRIRFGNNIVNHLVDLEYGNETIASFDLFEFNKTKEFNVSIPVSELSTNPTFTLANKLNPNIEKSMISVAELTYPRAFNFQDSSYAEFYLPASTEDQLLRIKNFDGAANTILIDLTSETIVPVVIDGNDVTAIITQSVQERKFVIANIERQVKTVNSIEETSFIDYTTQDPGYIILTSRKLDIGDDNPIDAYRDYRTSADGGGYDVSVVHSEDLYDQFAYGVDRHSASIVNFSQFIRQYWVNAEFNFVIGKAFEYQEVRSREQYEEFEQSFMVPTFGSPGSDNMLFSKKGSAIPYLPTGRLAARTTDDVANYLDKIKLHENPLDNNQTIDDQLWKKEIIHLSGGDADLIAIIFNSLELMRNIAERSRLGANVTTFRKTSTDALQTSRTDEIIKKINDGASLITFFGHSAVGTFDFSLENPALYDNTGRLPLIISLGCYSGNIHTSTFGLSESFVLEKDRGALAFLAASSTAYLNPQKDTGIGYYTMFSDSLYGAAVGKLLHEELIARDGLPHISNISLNQQLTLHGDPAITIHESEGADYVVDYESISTNPDIIGTSETSFDVNFDVYNLGINESDSLTVLGIHELPDGSITDSVYLTIAAPKFKQEASIEFQMPGIAARGKNRVKLILDPAQSIQELPAPAAENNNKAIDPSGEEGYCFFIVDNNATPVYPTEYSIVSDQNIELKASTSNGLAAEQQYNIQLDTTELFNSPNLLSQTITQRGGLISWAPDVQLSQNTVYYWRISPVKAEETERTWSNSSFVYMANSTEGWNQSHYYQMKDGTEANLYLKEDTRQLTYTKARKDIRIKNQFKVADGQDFWVYVDGAAWGSLNPEARVPIIGVQVWDPNDFFFFNIAEDGSHTEFGSIPWSRDLYAYRMDKLEDRKNIKELIDAAPDSTRIIFQTYLDDETSDLHPEEWAADSTILGYNLFSVLEGYGATKVRLLEERGTVPYTFVFDKSGGVLLEEIGENIYDFHDVTTHFDVFQDFGTYSSELIGPATKWSTLEWSETKDQAIIEEGDNTSLTLYGINASGQDTILTTLVDQYSYDLSNISAVDYPYLRLEYYAYDKAANTPGQIDYWRVLFDEAADAAISLQQEYVFEGDTLQQGQDLYLKMGLDHISGADMDSMLVTYTLKDGSNNIINEDKRFAPLPKGSKYPIAYTKNTLNLKGDYELSVTVNPNEDQPEKFSFNNFAITRFHVEPDGGNPLLDVTVDGLHILSGDIVSTNPFIVATLKDDNPYIKIDDIEQFELALTYPDGNVWQVPLTHESINFIPADDEENIGKLEFNPTLDQEGLYKLEIQGRDKSNNFSGEYAYQVDFQVILGQKVSNVINYPNPFSTSTQFVFTLTGNVPSSYFIQVMTLTGKVVKEITQEELGAVRVGVNRSSYRWDGTDDFGNRLANGVYLYRMVTKDANNETLESLSTDIDQYYKDGYGKLVIMR